MSLQGKVTNDIREIMDLPMGQDRINRLADLLNMLTALGSVTLQEDKGKVPPELYMAGFNAIVSLFLAETKDTITLENKMAFIQTIVSMTTHCIHDIREGADGTEEIH